MPSDENVSCLILEESVHCVLLEKSFHSLVSAVTEVFFCFLMTYTHRNHLASFPGLARLSLAVRNSRKLFRKRRTREGLVTRLEITSLVHRQIFLAN